MIKSSKVLILSKQAIMLSPLLLMALWTGCSDNASDTKDYPIKPVPFTAVEVRDDFWSKRLDINHHVTIPIAFKKAEETGRIDNFMIAGGLKDGKFASIYPFDDSDVFKNIEAASYSMMLFPDDSLDRYLDTLISYIAAAQEPDGYLYTNRTIDPESTHEMAGRERWINEEESSHELYNVGHLYEAAVAHFQATGKRTLLDVALKNANLIDRLFGWGKIEKAPGHQEIEIGLVKLYRLTGEKKYLDLAKFFLDVRGPNGDSYNQMHAKVTDQRIAVGHAVRAQYMYAAMADIAALTGENKYLQAIDTLWKDVVNGKTYLTGGIGAAGNIEGFGEPYDLPNLTAYCETCASIANALWNYRMFLLHGNSEYFDTFEKVLYNGLLSGVSLSGDHFFYPNPLSSDGRYSRKPWFGCACCPVNVTRFLPSVPGYVYAVEKDKLYVNLYLGNEADIEISGRIFRITQETGYPWEGLVKLRLGMEKSEKLSLMVRIPGWARNDAFPGDLYEFGEDSREQTEIILNGKRAVFEYRDGYAVIDRKWSDGDEIIVRFPMMPRRVIANDKVTEDLQKVALQYGPVIYCVESPDLSPASVKDLIINKNSKIEFLYNPDILNGVGMLYGNGQARIEDENGKVSVVPQDFTAIPYFSWANRGPSEMGVWIRSSN